MGKPLTFLRQQSVGAPVPRRDVDDLVASLVGSAGRGGVDSDDLTPGSSIPGSPSLSHATGLPGQSLLTLSGRASRQSDGASSERVVQPVQSANSATDHVVDRYMCFTLRTQTS
jgi:dynein intermediate chain, cytosolic